VWDAASGQVKRTLKDHVDGVFGVAYSPDGKWLATGSLDRTIKLYQTDTGARVSSFSHNDGVSAVAFSAKSDLVVAAAEKQVRVWPVKAGTVENPLRGHGEGEAINAVTFSADGSLFAWAASNRRVRLWSGDVSNHRRELGDCPDWVYTVSLSPDAKTVSGGGGDGKVYTWSTGDGKLLYSVPLGPVADRVASAPAGEKK
jgi:WD40 repeat protein